MTVIYTCPLWTKMYCMCTKHHPIIGFILYLAKTRLTKQVDLTQSMPVSDDPDSKGDKALPSDTIYGYLVEIRATHWLSSISTYCIPGMGHRQLWLKSVRPKNQLKSVKAYGCKLCKFWHSVEINYVHLLKTNSHWHVFARSSLVNKMNECGFMFDQAVSN